MLQGFSSPHIPLMTLQSAWSDWLARLKPWATRLKPSRPSKRSPGSAVSIRGELIKTIVGDASLPTDIRQQPECAQTDMKVGEASSLRAIEKYADEGAYPCQLAVRSMRGDIGLPCCGTMLGLLGCDGAPHPAASSCSCLATMDSLSPLDLIRITSL